MFADGFFRVKSNDDAKVYSKMGTLAKGLPFSCNFNVFL